MSDRHNAGCERLKALADSINDTARMARAMLSLLLVVALYLGFTLLSSTDENLILNAEVAILQVGSGIALKQSYTFGPWVFLYLHLQALFLLSILHRKMANFDTTLHSEPHNLQSERQEHWDWLSAFAFVQRLRPDHRFRLSSRFLMWTSTEALPLARLFIITLSFVRYQSEWITWGHKFVFVLALVSVIVFNFSVSRIHLHPLRELPNQIALCWKRQKCIWIRIRILLRAVLAILMTLVLFMWAKPPNFDLASYEGNSKDLWKVMKEKRSLIWRTEANDQEMSEESIQRTNAAPCIRSHPCPAPRRQSTSVEKVRLWENNFLDAIPCEWSGFACRYLDARNLWLVTSRLDYVPVSGSNGLIDANSEETQWFHINRLSLSERNLRFADLRRTQLQGANLESARLQGANLEEANLQDALLERAHMHGAYLNNADLQDAVLSSAELEGANLKRTRLQRANLSEAQLRNVSLKEAELQSANLVLANLQGADMESVRLDDASLREADLKGARLENAWLWGANLSDVELEGANLQNAKLEGANLRKARLGNTCLEGAQLEGVDLSGAEIRGSRGTPDSWDLAWPPNVLDLNKPYIASGELDEAAEQGRLLFMSVSELQRFPVPSKHWDKLAIWTAKFACRNKYTARSSWKRWRGDDPLDGMKILVNEKILDRVKGRTLQLFLGGRECEECAGLSDISNDQWKRWRRELAETGSAISRMHGVFDAHPVCGSSAIPNRPKRGWRSCLSNDDVRPIPD